MEYRNYAYDSLFTAALAEGYFLADRIREAVPWGLGKLYRRTGDRAKAAEHLTIAATMYREMDMGFWLEKAEAELGSPLGTHSEQGKPAELAT